MTIQPVSDIILDVANAADPARAAAAKQRLAEAAGGYFTHLFSNTSHSNDHSWSDVSRARFFSDTSGRASSGAGTSDDAKRGLETLIAKMLIETMLPKESEASFGKGTAGNVWRSMMADRLAEDLTRGSGLGILKNVSLQREKQV